MKYCRAATHNMIASLKEGDVHISDIFVETQDADKSLRRGSSQYKDTVLQG